MSSIKAVVFLSLSILLAGHASHAEDQGESIDITQEEMSALQSDGRGPLQLDGHTYSIAENDELLIDGKSVDMPYAAKIFLGKMPGMEKTHLFIWFLIKDNGITGHNGGLYVYRPDSYYNTWDKYQMGTPYVGSFDDVTEYHGQIYLLGESNSYAQFYYPVAAVTNGYGTFSSITIGAHASRFLKRKDGLYIISPLSRGAYLRSAGSLQAYDSWARSSNGSGVTFVARTYPVRLNGVQLPISLIKVQ